MAEASAIDWRGIPGFPGYLVNNRGEIRSVKRRPCVLKPYRVRGYLHVLLWRGRKTKKVRLHHAVLLAFVGPPPPGCHARHLNDDPSDNRLENLAWGTPKQNAADKIRNGRQFRGQASPAAKLSERQVVEIRRRHASGETLRALGRAFGVSHTAIRRAATGRTWAHIEGVS